MDRIFALRENEAAEAAIPTSLKPVDQPLDLQLAAKNKERRDRVSSEETSSKRRRMEDSQPQRKIVDKLQAKDGSGQPTRISEIRLRENGFHHEEPHSRAQSVLQTNTPSIEQILDKVKSQPQNPHLLRSRDSRTGIKPRTIERSPSYDDVIPEESRYSKVHGLGSRWKKPLVYPRDGKKKTTVDWTDLERLDEGQFLNDNLIGFYLRYLESKLGDEAPDVAEKVYWFNTYFFASLTQTPRGKKGINYEAVRKWTRNIDIFNYDYAIVPINESAHWYVAIICNLPALNRIPARSSEEALSSPKVKKREVMEKDDIGPKASFTSLNSLELEGPRELEGCHRNEVKKPVEQDTTESFAELNLDDGLVEDPSGKSKSDYMNEKEILIGNQEQCQWTTHLESYLLECEKASDIPNVDNPPTVKTSSQKKSRRKSNFPPKTWDPDLPVIITLDSLGLPHSPTTRILKDYLRAEAEDKRGGMQWEDGQIKGMTAKHIPLQDNFCDCGLFLLGYMDKFIEDPRKFIVKILQNEYDETRDWPNLVASRMRANIRELIQDLHADQQPVRVHNASKTVGRMVKRNDEGTTEEHREDPANVDVGVTDTISTINEAAWSTHAAPLLFDEEALATFPWKHEPIIQHGDNTEASIQVQIPTHEKNNRMATESSTFREPSVVILDSQPESSTDVVTKMKKQERLEFPDALVDSKPTTSASTSPLSILPNQVDPLKDIHHYPS